MGFHGGRHWPLILCPPGPFRGKGVVGFGVMGEFGGSITEYGWDDLTYCVVNICSSLWAFLSCDAYVSEHSCRERPLSSFLLIPILPVPQS